MKLTLGQAATEWKISKSTLSKAIKSGKVSAEVNRDGSKAIDPAEMERVYGKPGENSSKRTVGHRLKETQKPLETVEELARLRAENEGLRARLADWQGQVEKVELDRDEWRDQAKRLMIEHKSDAAIVTTPPSSDKPPEATGRPLTLMERIRGRVDTKNP